MSQIDHEAVLAATRAWLEKAVIGLNLCPFAKSVYVKNQVRIQISEAATPEQLAEELAAELKLLAETPAEEIDTTLLVHPGVLQRFLDFNDFQDVADGLIDMLGLEGVLQVASFHPRFQFDGTGINDIENYTNRSPYPTLHLIREASIDRAVEAFPEADAIYEKNMETMRELGVEGWKKLFQS